jgi:hypothetical protein
MMDPLLQSIAAVVSKSDGRVWGTAFFLGPGVALTCSHVVRPLGNASVQLVRPPSTTDAGLEPAFAGLPRLDVTAIDADDDLDLALLRVSSEHHGWLALTDRWDLGTEVFSRGYHRSVATYPGGDAVSGIIVGSGPVIYRGHQTQLLTLQDLSAAPGLSGGPLVAKVSDDLYAAVGIVRLRAKDERAHAIPVSTIAARWPGLRLVEDMPVLAPAPAFDDLRTSAGPTINRWREFAPTDVHCVVVESEGGRADQRPFGKLVTTALSNGEHRVLDAFSEYWTDGRRLLDGSTRCQRDSLASVVTASFNVLDAFSRYANLNEAVRLVVEADIGFFDVTRFEPGVMLLLGIRAAARRGVTIVSHGGGWYLGNPLQRPFNLADLSIASHSWEGMADPDPREEMLLRWVEVGYEQLAYQPRYLDMPVYEALRNLGPQFRAWSPIDLLSEVLVLCPYSDQFWPIWLDLRPRLQSALREKSGSSSAPRVVRLQDLPSPQLASQLLYEKIRRCDGCIGDWTFRSPSTFFEIGVRLAVSPKGVVQTAERNWLESDEAQALAQIAAMRAIFSPLDYTAMDGLAATFDPTIADRVAAQLLALTTDLESAGHPLRRTVVEAVGRTEQQLATVYESLVDAADILHHSQREVDERDAGSQALFADLAEVKANYEQAAVARRLAAWLYLEHRLKAGASDNESLKKTWRELGASVSAALYEVDLDLALEIEERIASSD